MDTRDKKFSDYMLVYVKNCTFVHITNTIFPVTGRLRRPLASHWLPPPKVEVLEPPLVVVGILFRRYRGWYGLLDACCTVSGVATTPWLDAHLVRLWRHACVMTPRLNDVITRQRHAQHKDRNSFSSAHAHCRWRQFQRSCTTYVKILGDLST